jgi:beta-ketodecanoyl-[acyl-carrier-protein] synthase
LHKVVISGTGLYTPPNSISNEELVEAFNAYVDLHNEEHATAIEAGEMAALEKSSAEFIEKASGVKSRFVVEKSGILDPARMCPNIPARPDDEISVLAEMGVSAANDALKNAGRTASDVDGVLCAASNMQRGYPAMAVEIQMALGATGFGFDMNVACSSATFGLQTAADMIRSGSARRILVVSPEICTGHLNFRDRDSHFIFGDVATAVLLENAEDATSDECWEILGTKLVTRFSNNIRNNFGFLNRTDGDNSIEQTTHDTDKLFNQVGRKVMREVVPMVSDIMRDHCAEVGVDPTTADRVWLHQANIHMNEMISRRVLDRSIDAISTPTILDDYANTSSAGSIIAFHKHSRDLASGSLGLLCSFGAGYSVGSVILRKSA